MIPRGLLKEYAGPLSMLLRLLDMAAIVVAGLLAYAYKFGDLDVPEPYIKALVISAVYTLAVFSFFRIYQSVRTKSFWEHIRTLAQAIAIVLMSMAGTAFLTKTGASFSRGWFACWVILSFLLLLLFRGTLLSLLRLMRASRWNERRVIIIGANELGQRLSDSMQQALWTGIRIVAIFDDEVAGKPANIGGVAVKPMPADICQYLSERKEAIDEIWLALPLSAEERIKALMQSWHYGSGWLSLSRAEFLAHGGGESTGQGIRRSGAGLPDSDSDQSLVVADCVSGEMYLAGSGVFQAITPWLGWAHY
jgi:putative colanic acid biosynthesis UDP-glucose lipid carrier transferase